MKPLVSFAVKALRVGPLPYMALCVAVIGVGAFLQFRSGTTQNLSDGSTLFGIFAQIGGCIGLFGLLTLIFNGLPAEPRPGMAEDDVPASARAARLDAATARGMRPQRMAENGGLDTPAAPASAPPAPLPSGSQASALKSPAAKAGLRMARQMGMQAIRGLARRG